MSSSIIVSGTPHVRSKESIQSIMRDVIIALVPASVMGIYYFGLKALLLIAVSIISSVFFEWGYEKILKKPITVTDLSAVLTGLLLALNLPASASWWVPVVGAFVAMGDLVRTASTPPLSDVLSLLQLILRRQQVRLSLQEEW